MLSSNTAAGEQDAVAPHLAHLIDAAAHPEAESPSGITDSRIPPSITDSLIPSGDHPYYKLTERTTALRHQSESLLQDVGPRYYVSHVAGSEIEQLLKDIAKHIRNRKACIKFGMVDPFPQSLKDRKIRTFQDGLLRVCDEMSQAAKRMQAGQAKDSEEIVRPPNCDRTVLRHDSDQLGAQQSALYRLGASLFVKTLP